MLDRAESLEKDRRAAITELEAQQARRNRLTQEVAQKRKAGEDATALIAEGRVQVNGAVVRTIGTRVCYPLAREDTEPQPHGIPRRFPSRRSVPGDRSCLNA